MLQKNIHSVINIRIKVSFLSHRKSYEPDIDLVRRHDRLEMAEVLGASIGALAFGAAGVAALTELISDQSDQLLVAGTLAGIAIGGLAIATHAGSKLPTLKSILQADAQTETQSTPIRSD
jgi:hypothetical protein